MRIFSKSNILLLILLILILIYMNCSYVTHGITSIISKSFPGAVYYVNTNEKLLALTIDDGPDSITTPAILETLEKYNARATFFLISSYIENNSEIVTRIAEQGHEIGNHMTHDEPSHKLSKAKFIRKFNEADSIFSQYAKVRWFRPGSGFYNEWMIEYIESRGYRCALGSVYPVDTITRSSSFSSFYISMTVRPGSIIILHDRGARGALTVETLHTILPILKNRGYEFVTLSELVDSAK
ncbi:polysaccharide deacetylase family protein [candidate division KSB1 bacterium]|nr:polysaccharide deacetylase family protein [candidate division KSB1 bacterium]